MNSNLMQFAKQYLPYIKLLYFGLSDNFINFNNSEDLYRGALIDKIEMQNLINPTKI